MNNRMSVTTRIIAAVGGLALAGALLLPIWRIELSAPQYPEGLVLQIFAHKLGGDVEVVNGLNHYIGMRTLHEKDFVEFLVLPFIIGAFGLFGLLSSIINRKWFFYTWVVLFLLFAATAMIDFYRWEHNYGHNLDPTAPIQVPGMTYQPPLIGYKQLLNFGAYSIPDAGGWILVAVGLTAVFAAFYELKKTRRAMKIRMVGMAAATIMVMLLFQSCSSGPRPIVVGTDACTFCKMTISDTKFGAELITPKGKVYKFDDLNCFTLFLKSNIINQHQAHEIYLVDFSSKGQLVKATECFLLRSENLRGPMGSQVAAFTSRDSLLSFQQQLSGKQFGWNEIYP